ncbi:unnamed protein product [Polarella glacialis]|uniref:Uncharacterized protein n=1 Tax=Polarella glacialis TaxID=89957 RepID=A0A813J346_POLGL|nr:unnamed protein product [Polarella glacialis]
MAPYALPCLLDWSRGSSNFGDEKLYIAILQEYSQQLLISVGTVEDTFKREDQAALREEVLRIQGSASYVAAERLRASAIALISALDSRSGNIAALVGSLCDQARALCVEVRSLVAAGGPRQAGPKGARAEEADELLPVLEGSGNGETQPRKCSGCSLQ